MILVTFFVVVYSSEKPSLLRCPLQVHGNGDQRYNWTLYLANLRRVVLTADRYHLRKEQHKEDENPEIRLEFNITQCRNVCLKQAQKKLTSRWISWQIMQSERQQCNNPLFLIQNPSKAWGQQLLYNIFTNFSQQRSKVPISKKCPSIFPRKNQRQPTFPVIFTSPPLGHPRLAQLGCFCNSETKTPKGRKWSAASKSDRVTLRDVMFFFASKSWGEQPTTKTRGRKKGGGLKWFENVFWI